VHDLFTLQQFEDPIKHAALGPAIHSGINGVPGAETLWQSAPFAAMLGDEQQSIHKLQIGDPNVAALARQRRLDAAKLLLGDLHLRTIAQKHPLSVNTPQVGV